MCIIVSRALSLLHRLTSEPVVLRFEDGKRQLALSPDDLMNSVMNFLWDVVIYSFLIEEKKKKQRKDL